MYEIDGNWSMTSIVIVVELIATSFVALIVYTSDSDRILGVPEIVPVTEENCRPVGSCGWIDQAETSPPSFVGTMF